MMLDFEKAIEIMNKYGYTSINVHPFIYQDGDTIGICYKYLDEEFGELERINIFDNAEDFENFLKKYNWCLTNGKTRHVRMILDNYESINPEVIFLRNEKVMVEGEMEDIDEYDRRESLRVNMDPPSKVIYECGDLLLVYNEIKNRQLQYLTNIIKLKNSLRQKYFDLQKEVDIYNKLKVERNLTLLPEIADSGIDEALEASIKEKYNRYITNIPEYGEALNFLKEVWDLCLGLELNSKYYEAQKEDNDIRNETRIVMKKLTLIRSLNDDLKPLFGTDLIGRFRKINRECKRESSTMDNSFITGQMDSVSKKYSYFDKLDPLFTSDYLREAIQNTNYEDLAIKYAKGTNFEIVSKFRTPVNEIASSLSIQYRDNFSRDEQSIMVLYNNPKYRILFNAILDIPNFSEVPIKNLLRKISKVNGFSKLKSECYDSVKKRIDDPVNSKVKDFLFYDVDFTTFETFMSGLIVRLAKLKGVKGRMVLNGDINMFMSISKVKEIQKSLYVTTTNNLPLVKEVTSGTKNSIGIVLLKKGTPVLYSPYYFELGDTYNDTNPLMGIKEMVDFDLLVDMSNILVNVDSNKRVVVDYYTTPNIVGNMSIVDSLRMKDKFNFYKCAFTSAMSTEIMANPSKSVASEVSPVVNSVINEVSVDNVPIEKQQPVVNVSQAPVNGTNNVVNTSTNDKKEVSSIEKPKVEAVPIAKPKVEAAKPKVEAAKPKVMAVPHVEETKVAGSSLEKPKVTATHIEKPIVQTVSHTQKPTVQVVPHVEKPKVDVINKGIKKEQVPVDKVQVINNGERKVVSSPLQKEEAKTESPIVKEQPSKENSVIKKPIGVELKKEAVKATPTINAKDVTKPNDVNASLKPVTPRVIAKPVVDNKDKE